MVDLFAWCEYLPHRKGVQTMVVVVIGWI